jgi:TATA-box binding protein (TBP) (component of TFIID and TFIIIB)
MTLEVTKVTEAQLKTECCVTSQKLLNEVKISTITLTTKLPGCLLNLTNIGKYLNIDEEIIGIKYNYANLNIMKGKYSTTIYKKAKVKNVEKINKMLFYNQISIIFNNNGNNVNIKLFGNGSLHLTGCKSINEGNIITKKLYEKLNVLRDKTDTILITRDLNNILVDKDNIVYSYKNNQIIGYRKDLDLRKYVIHNKNFTIDNKTNMYITEKMETQRRHFIYNLDGELIGFSKIELLKNRSKFYTKNGNIFIDTENQLIYHNNDTIIGKIIYDIDWVKITDISQGADILEIEYNCNPFIDTNYSINTDTDFDLNVNCMNVYFNINYKINRQRLYDYLINENYICKYNPESYSGIKLIYKLPLQKTEDMISGFCPCTNKCTCINIVFLIFQSGNVIATGFKNNDQIKFVVDKFMVLTDNVKESIIKKTFV